MIIDPIEYEGDYVRNFIQMEALVFKSELTEEEANKLKELTCMVEKYERNNLDKLI